MFIINQFSVCITHFHESFSQFHKVVRSKTQLKHHSLLDHQIVNTYKPFSTNFSSRNTFPRFSPKSHRPFVRAFFDQRAPNRATSRSKSTSSRAWPLQLERQQHQTLTRCSRRAYNTSDDSARHFAHSSAHEIARTLGADN